jgi:predicted nicotinamide N-methyase
MRALKVNFADTDESVSVTIVSEDDLDYSQNLWPSGHVLAWYLFHHREALVHQRCVLEIGGGTSLPGLLCAKIGAKHVVLTDRHRTSGWVAWNVVFCAPTPILFPIF